MSAQLKLPYDTGWKAPGPSKDTADQVRGRSGRLRGAVLDCLKRHGAMTADECAARLRESVLAIRPRFTELLAANAITDTGERRENDSGRKATVWRARTSA